MLPPASDHELAAGLHSFVMPELFAESNDARLLQVLNGTSALDGRGAAAAATHVPEAFVEVALVKKAHVGNSRAIRCIGSTVGETS
jgi:hypothetical protein